MNFFSFLEHEHAGKVLILTMKFMLTNDKVTIVKQQQNNRNKMPRKKGKNYLIINFTDIVKQ